MYDFFVMTIITKEKKQFRSDNMFIVAGKSSDATKAIDDSDSGIRFSIKQENIYKQR